MLGIETLSPRYLEHGRFDELQPADCFQAKFSSFREKQNYKNMSSISISMKLFKNEENLLLIPITGKLFCHNENVLPKSISISKLDIEVH